MHLTTCTSSHLALRLAWINNNNNNNKIKRMEHSYPVLVNMLGGNVAFYPFRDAPSLLRTLQRCGERIFILSVDLEEAAEVLYLAYKQSLIWS